MTPEESPAAPYEHPYQLCWTFVPLLVIRHGIRTPFSGVIGIQSGPWGLWVHSGFHGGHGGLVRDAGSEDDREDPPGVFVQQMPIKAICRELAGC